MAGTLGIISLVASTTILAYFSISTDRPAHLSFLVAVLVVLFLFGFKTRYSSQGGTSKQDEYIPLSEGVQHESTVDGNPYRERLQNVTTLRYALVGAITVALIVRVTDLQRTQRGSECHTRNLEVWTPFLLAVYDAIRHQKGAIIQVDGDIDNTAYQDFLHNVKATFLGNRWRYVPWSFLLSLGCYLVLGLRSTSQSSYICPIAGSLRTTIPRSQVSALVLDAFIAICAMEIVVPASSKTDAHHSLKANVSSSLLVSQLFVASWTIIAWLYFAVQPEDRSWILMLDGSNIALVLAQAVVLAAYVLQLLYTASTSGFLRTCLLLAAILTAVPGLHFLWSESRPYPPVSTLSLTWSFILIYLGWSWYQWVDAYFADVKHNPSLLRRCAVWMLILVVLYPGLMKSNTVSFHPIDLLMFSAQKQYIEYVDHATRSQSLADAVKTYQHRYQDNPPPGFDIWFEFAQNKSTFVVDEFDQIHTDILPFRAILPSKLRQKTWEMVSNPYNEISGISIRNGNARVQDNVLPTHRWMLEGVEHLINSFSEHLPDMDLAFNLNDEARVAVKHYDLKRLETTARQTPLQGRMSISKARSQDWLNITEEGTSHTDFENWSFRNVYHEWGTAGCATAPPSAPPRSQICTSCAARHSLGQFIANWSLSASPCHQPDLAHLHGFYLSPAAFKATHELLPVFSQSKPDGFNDVLYPSAWNYMDKVAYAPTNVSTGDADTPEYRPAYPDSPFPEKIPTLYWRGATSEGGSAGNGVWQGMTRQRIVHLTNNLTSHPHDMQTLLLPESGHSGKQRYVYTAMSGTDIQKLNLSTDIHFVPPITRCGGVDCPRQEAEFGFAQPADFQHHWSYKYLIDLDGAGFSGRFLPFLQSHSLVFKTALFREWYDSRLVPWLHFVPLDIRLHGFWSTLVYFTGISGSSATSNGKNYEWKAHEREAELIAEAGREWVAKALRKEDMEVYFFRLLLEWARLVDDKRDELGFVLDE